MKFINSKLHGVIDYLFDGMFLFAPTLFGLSAIPATICYTLAAVHFVMSLCTQYELSLVKLIPFKTHGMIELVVAIGLLFTPWIAGFSLEPYARNYFLGSGIALFLVWMTTDYKSTTKVAVLQKSEDLRFKEAS